MSYGPLDVPNADVLASLGARQNGRTYLDEAKEAQAYAAEHGILHRGWRFYPPYACHACGRAISAQQFAFARSCGGCDVSGGRTARLQIFDKRWLLDGRAVDERKGDRLDIDPEFIPASECEKYPRKVAPPRPKQPRSFPPRMR